MNQLQTCDTIVAHVLVVGFHAQLGNRIEFAYPRLRGDPILRSLTLSDTSDISFGVPASKIVPRNDNDDCLNVDIETTEAEENNTSDLLVQDWGTLPDDWSFLPFMALPDGVHDHDHDLAFFTLPQNVHCVACFQQVTIDASKCHSLTFRATYENGFSSRGSVQKAVVLLSRRPYYGVLAKQLVPAVRAYFDQADFTKTQILTSLLHSLNRSLTAFPVPRDVTIFDSLDLRLLLRRLGPQLLAVLKLILLEKRIVLYSQPVYPASNAVIAMASLFNGALDTIAPNLNPLDNSPADAIVGLPLSIFGPGDRVILQPYAPLPLISKLLSNYQKKGCLIGTSHNTGLLLLSTATANARKVAASRQFNSTSDRPAPQMTRVYPTFTQPRLTPSPQSSRYSHRECRPFRTNHTEVQDTTSNVPIVDALVDFSTGKVTVSADLESYCRITNEERLFMRDLIASTFQATSAPVLPRSTGPPPGSNEYIRERFRLYLSHFLHSVASIDSICGGPIGGETWNREMVQQFDLSEMIVYNERFVRRWLTTRNAAEWARRCSLQHSKVLPPPTAEAGNALKHSGHKPLNGEAVSTSLSVLRNNMTELGRLSTEVSAKAAKTLSNIFKHFELEMIKMDSVAGRRQR